jgi:proline iminopeptidase
MRGRYPAIDPYASGLLDVGDGHRTCWEVCGNPQGAPALVLHGGPGSGCGPGLRRYFDPSRYRIVLFDLPPEDRDGDLAAGYARLLA